MNPKLNDAFRKQVLKIKTCPVTSHYLKVFIFILLLMWGCNH